MIEGLLYLKSGAELLIGGLAFPTQFNLLFFLARLVFCYV